jgi:hypothetical protein
VPDYFDELLERIRDIRASERRMYLRVRDILALAADYQPSSDDTQRVFQIIQNKLHFAVTGKTAPELIAERADASQPNMGLTTWKGAVVRQPDVTVAKNYLSETEIVELNRILVMFLDFAEDQARRRKQVFLRDWQQKLDEFLRFNERDVLPTPVTSRARRRTARRRASTTRLRSGAGTRPSTRAKPTPSARWSKPRKRCRRASRARAAARESGHPLNVPPHTRDREETA